MKNVIAIIPARLGSSRLPNKPLKLINGISLLERCYNLTSKAVGNENTYIATCDNEIIEHAKTFSANYIKTSKKHLRATTRTYEALLKIEKMFNMKVKQVLMVQGDEPTIKYNDLKKFISNHIKKNYGISNLVSIIHDHKIFEDKNYVKIVKNFKNEILYFSREPIPSLKLSKKNFNKYQQVGVIAFRRKELFMFNSMKQSNLEIIESIDMNRCIENKIPIHCYPINYQTYGVDTKSDLLLVKKILKS